MTVFGRSHAQNLILSFDPGPGKTGVTGWAVLEIMVSQALHLVLQVGALQNPTDGNPVDRIDGIVKAIVSDELCEVPLERLKAVFVEGAVWNPENRNCASYGHQEYLVGQLLGWFRGYQVPCVERINPRTAKKVVTGNGNATKEEVREHMLKHISSTWPAFALKIHPKMTKKIAEAIVDAVSIGIAGERIYL